MTNYAWHTWRVGLRKTKIDVRIRTRIITETDSYLIIVVSSREIHCWWGVKIEGRCVFRALDPRRHNSLTFIKRCEWEKYKITINHSGLIQMHFQINSLFHNHLTMLFSHRDFRSNCLSCMWLTHEHMFILWTYLCDILHQFVNWCYRFSFLVDISKQWPVGMYISTLKEGKVIA